MDGGTPKREKANVRVYKASEVHKRRAPLQAKAATTSTPELPEHEAAPQPRASRIRQASPQAPAASKAIRTPVSAQASSTSTTSSFDKLLAEKLAEKETAKKSKKVKKAKKTKRPDGFENPGNSESPAKPEKPKRRWGRRIAVGIFAFIAALLLIALGLFLGNRWLRYDDAHAIQGAWYVEGTSVLVTISETEIQLNDDTSYKYAIDPTAKTITYDFGNLAGGGHYWFSEDRSHLVIFDGEGYTVWGTLIEDLGRTLGDLSASLLGGGIEFPEGENVTVFSRKPGALSAPQSATATISSREGASAPSASRAEEGDFASRSASESASKSESASESASESESDGRLDESPSTIEG